MVPVFELTDGQLEDVTQIFMKMQAEMISDYVHKYDLLRNLIFDLLHYTLKMQPASKTEKQQPNASQRITHLFLELLERQFPIEDVTQQIRFRSPSEFAGQLSVHVNHLNRVIKEVTEKTTSEIIAERLLQEAKILLRHTDWNISEIAYTLAFKEATHFNNFFKKNMQITPNQFREISNVDG
ncbi:helix-turn-helix domain-containing protein [Chryseobacterium taeanense]|uniref:helix-turn-helix domain-containing protein n=1 Tax=Chryseobacterium taeanense TaxID=311334 RepID=UPI0035B43AC5